MADAPRKKKLPFKPTALRMAAPASQAEDNNADDDLALFKRSKEMAPIVAAEQMRRWKKKQRQMEEDEERRRSSAGSKHALGDDDAENGGDEADQVPDANEVDDEDIYEAPRTQDPGPAADQGAADNLAITPPPSKRSRLTTSSSASSSRHGRAKQDTTSLGNSPSSRITRSRATAAAPAAAPNSASPSAQVPTATEIITLDSDSEPELTAAPSPQPASRDDLVEEDPLELNDAPSDDDEFAEYVRRAEQQRARDLLATQTSLSSSTLPAETPPPKEIVEIIITSDLAGSKPCCIKFLFDRPLRVVRDSWIALQRKHRIPLPLEQDDDVVLTWRRRRVYMFSTLLNLGIRPKGDGTVVVEGSSGTYNRDGLAEARTRVHMEAWTPELFAQMERDEEIRRKRDAGELDDDDYDYESERGGNRDTQDGAEAGQGEGGGDQVKLRIILKPKDLEPVKLMVRPETTVETLLTAFRTQQDVGGEGAEVALWFDGMRLEEDTTMEEAEIDDMDTIEVHIK